MQQTTSEAAKRGSAFWAMEMKEAADEDPPKILWNKEEYYRLSD